MHVLANSMTTSRNSAFECEQSCCAAAAYYTSFASVGVVVYFLRTRKGYRSLPEAINLRYGPLATLSFGAAVFFRLYQEVWSNAVVV